SECRVHAANCRRLAAEATNKAVKETFSNLAEHWEQLARELAAAQAFLKAMAELAADGYWVGLNTIRSAMAARRNLLSGPWCWESQGLHPPAALHFDACGSIRACRPTQGSSMAPSQQEGFPVSINFSQSGSSGSNLYPAACMQ